MKKTRKAIVQCYETPAAYDEREQVTQVLTEAGVFGYQEKLTAKWLMENLLKASSDSFGLQDLMSEAIRQLDYDLDLLGQAKALEMEVKRLKGAQKVQPANRRSMTD